MVKKHTSYRISEEGKQLLKLLARRLGVSETAVLEMSIREMAEKKGVKVEHGGIQQYSERESRS